MEHIPIVYLWVDGNDENYRKKYCIKKSSRNRDNQDLLHSLRSIEKYMPWWKGKLYIISDNQKPQWIDENKVIFIDQKKIIPERYSPSFNSHFIQRYIHNIKDINDKYILFDDDNILNDFVNPEDFIKDGKLINQFNKTILNEKELDSIDIKNNIWKASVFKTINILMKKLKINFNKYYLHHSPFVFSIESIKSCNKLFKNELEKNIYQFRDFDIITSYLYLYYYNITNNIIIKPTDENIYFLNVKDNSNLEDINLNEYKFICFNDDFSNEEISQKLINIYEKLLPDKCNYEL